MIYFTRANKNDDKIATKDTSIIFLPFFSIHYKEDNDDIDAVIENLTEALDLLHKSKQKWWTNFYERHFNQFQLVQCNELELLNFCNNSIKV